MTNVPVTEEIPFPMSRKNIGNCFVIVIYDNEFNKGGGNDVEKKDVWEMHEDRIALIE